MAGESDLGTALRSGELTSEFAAMKSAGTWGIVSMILGALVSFGGEGLAMLHIAEDSKAGIWAGMTLALAGICLKGFTKLGYIKGRSDVKAAVIAAAAEAPEQPK